MSDYADDPEFREFARHVNAHLMPALSGSAMTVSLVPGGESSVDVKFAVELGLSIMLDKPIIAVVQPGTKVPERLVRVADRIVEADVYSEQGRERLQAAITAAMADLPGE